MLGAISTGEGRLEPGGYAIDSPAAPIAQLAEAADLKSVKCRFESDWGHRPVWPVSAIFAIDTALIRIAARLGATLPALTR